MRATLVIPSWNEREGIGYTLDHFLEAKEEANRTLFYNDPVEWKVLVVDGGSTDGTIELAEKRGAKVLVERRHGYGRAYKTGFDAAEGEYIATMDADGTYPGHEIPRLLLYLISIGGDFLSGNRLARIETKAMTTEHRLGNHMLNIAIQVLFHRYLKGVPTRRLADSQSGMWVFRRALLASLHLTQDGMALSEELKLEVLLHGFKLEEVPINYSERWGPPKLSSWRDGMMNMLWLFEKRFELSQEIRRTDQ